MVLGKLSTMQQMEYCSAEFGTQCRKWDRKSALHNLCPIFCLVCLRILLHQLDQQFALAKPTNKALTERPFQAHIHSWASTLQSWAHCSHPQDQYEWVCSHTSSVLLSNVLPICAVRPTHQKLLPHAYMWQRGMWAQCSNNQLDEKVPFFSATASAHRNIENAAGAKTMRHHMQWLLSNILCLVLMDVHTPPSTSCDQGRTHAVTATNLATTSLCFPREISRSVCFFSHFQHTQTAQYTCKHTHYALWPSAASVQALT